MIRLGLRLALAGGRGAVAGLALTATAVAIGSAILLFALSFAPAVGDRDSRTAWRDSDLQADAGQGGTMVAVFEDRTEGRLLTRVHLAPSGSGVAPDPTRHQGDAGSGRGVCLTRARGPHDDAAI